MKVAILTLHRVLNFGSALQAYCTCLVLKRIGCEPLIIDYIEPRYTILGAIKGIYRDALNGPSNGRGIARILLFLMKTVSYAIQYRNFERFASANLPLTQQRYSSLAALLASPPSADVYLTGSDQVWNSDYNGGVDRAHFLDFAPKGKPRISYATSFGKDNLRFEEISETRELLSRYSAISVRESSGVKIISDLGIRGAEQVLDPTLLLTKDEWAKEFDLPKPAEGRYLLIYSVERSVDKIVYSAARKIGNEMGLPVVFFSQAAKLSVMNGCESQRSFSTVTEFLRYFYHAEFVVASSFHGTAFAINFNRQFVSVLPPKFGARPRSLLSLVGLNGRLVEDQVDLAKIGALIDFGAVNKVLDRERKKSLAFLESALGVG